MNAISLLEEARRPFPSPCGVRRVGDSQTLIFSNHYHLLKFPSPCGVRRVGDSTIEFHDGAVWIKNYGPVLPERCFLRLPAGGILTPIERWIRVKSFVQVETNLIKGIKITRRTHVRGPILDLETVHEWVADGYYNCTKEDWSFEDAYRRIAKSLAMQRP
jgi:hypothetical protein